MAEKENSFSSALVLILVNLFPAFGVLYWGWDIFPMMLLFWSENIIIGFYNVFRMIVCSSKEDSSWIMKLFTIPFFIVHYGGFTAGHGFFVIALFGEGILEYSDGPRLELLWTMVLDANLPIAMLALFLSHGYSFFKNYIGRREYQRVSLSDLMGAPYGRIVLLHITLILGAFLIMFFRSPVAGLLFFVALKTGMDLFAHKKEHRKRNEQVK